MRDAIDEICTIVRSNSDGAVFLQKDDARMSQGNPEAHKFGGDWTQQKLAVLRKYLSAYTTALKNQPFKTAYIDAFAGTRYREIRHPEASGKGDQEYLFPDFAEPGQQELLDGSARIALSTTPRFDKYIFIELSRERCEDLDALRTEFPELSADISIEQGDANRLIQEICSRNWSRHRAVLFLDPYGMQVDWETLVAIAKTRAIDLWLLFPLGIGVNRILPRSGVVPEAWAAKLDRFLGTANWREEFYSRRPEQDLFGNHEVSAKASTGVIADYFVSRLKQVFPGVADKPGVLRNRSNCPLYLLCFAASNKRGAEPALRIARSLLREMV